MICNSSLKILRNQSPAISRAEYYFDACLKKEDKHNPEASVVIFQHKTDLIPKKMRKEVYHTCRDYIIKG